MCWQVEHRALPKKGLDGDLVVCKGPDVLLTHMARKLFKVHVTELSRNSGSNEVAAVVGANGA